MTTTTTTRRSSARNRPRRPSGARGFTLVELLAALAMVGVITLSLFACLRGAFKARDGAERRVEPARTANLAVDFLKADLEAAQPPRETLIGAFVGTDATDDRGRPGDSIAFYTTAPGPQHESGTGEVRRVEVGVVAAPLAGVTTSTVAPGGFALVRRVTSNLLASVQVEPDEEVLCRNVGAFDVEYWDGTVWVPTWDSSQYDDTLPAAVRITIELDRPTQLDPAVPDSLGPRFVRVIRLPCASTPEDDAGTGDATGTGGTP